MCQRSMMAFQANPRPMSSSTSLTKMRVPRNVARPWQMAGSATMYRPNVRFIFLTRCSATRVPAGRRVDVLLKIECDLFVAVAPTTNNERSRCLVSKKFGEPIVLNHEHADRCPLRSSHSAENPMVRVSHSRQTAIPRGIAMLRLGMNDVTRSVLSSIWPPNRLTEQNGHSCRRINVVFSRR